MMHPHMSKWFVYCLIASCFGSIAMVCAGALPYGWLWWAIEVLGWGSCAFWGYQAHWVMKEMSK